VINESLDIDHWRAALQRNGRVQIDDYLQPAAAERLRQCLEREVRWTLALRDADGSRTIDHATYAAMPRDAVAQLLAATAKETEASGADGAFRFAYDSYMMVSAYKEQRDPGLLLHRVLELFNSPEYVSFLRVLTGDGRVRRVNAQATRYTAGHFLRFHTDEEHGEGRLYAYVLNLSRNWSADWGGLLQFIGDDGRVQETFLPRWNTLSLFSVPAGHAVSLVAPWASEERLAITGWLLA
jgi:Rps23 Pro-64 3,4-dihydroxylase Tpa1-like proline 4-hydroxylase